MNDLAARKRLLLAEADLHRQLIGLERLQLVSRWDSALVFTPRSRWWLLGGALLGGALLARKWRQLVRWLPTAVALWRLFRS